MRLRSLGCLLLLLPLLPVEGQTIFGPNLVLNPGAESGPGGSGTSPVATVPGWTRTGGCDVYAYASAYQNVNGIQAMQDIIPRGTGNNYFAGGMNPANCAFQQNISLASGASGIDAGTATYAISAYLGGYRSDQDNATMMVAFLDSTGKQLNAYTVGPVQNVDRAYSQSGLYFRRQIGQVPTGARSATVTLNMNWVDGDYNEAFADNVSLVLNTPGPAQSAFNVNLVANPGADASTPGYNDNSTTSVSLDLPGWVRSTFFTADSYQLDGSGDLYMYTGGPTDANANYFYGGVDVVDDTNPISTAYQDIDVSAAASIIDGGKVTYALSGWLGGYSSQNDNSVVTLTFEDWTGKSLGSGTIGPVLAADRQDNSGLLFRNGSGVVPVGTRQIHVLITITRTDGINNDGLADDISLVLNPQTALGPSISQTIISAGAYGGFDSVSPGEYIEIYGANLALDTRQWSGTDFNGVNAPTSLDGVSVSVGGVPAVVYYISPTQIDALAPGSAALGPQPIVVTTANGVSVPFIETVNTVEPGLLAPAAFSVNGNQYVAALFSDGQTWVLPSNAIPGLASRPAKPGDPLLMYGVGFGSVTPNIPAGQVVGVSNTLAVPFRMMFGNVPAQVAYQGLAPSFVGLYQFDVTVPNVPNSDLVPLTFTLNGVPGAQTLYISVHN